MRSRSSSNTSTSNNNQGSLGGISLERKILPQFNSLTQEIRQHLLNFLAQQVRAAFTQADTALFNCAENAENNQVQDMFFESIREVRKQHVQIERAFLKNIANQFDDFIKAKKRPSAADAQIDAQQLSLVQNDEFEESLLVSSMSNKANERCIEALYAIEQRLALINSGIKSDDNSPLTPTVIANGFYTALAPSPFNLQVKTILYMLFEQFVMRELDQFYATINQAFISAGVLPNLNYSASQRKQRLMQAATKTTPNSPPATRTSTERQASNNMQSPKHGSSVASATPGNAIDAQTSLQAETLTVLLSTYRQQASSTILPDGVPSITAFTPSSATHKYSVAELLSALASLQQHNAQQAAQGFTMLAVDRSKQALVKQLQDLNSTASPGKVAEQHANTIDLVGMLFNFMIEDASLAQSSKAILSNLHPLYVQVALQDSTLFSQYQHPARKLLNGMAQAGVEYRGASEEKALQHKMQFTVSQALQSYKGDSILFDYLLQDFNVFVHALQRRAELREKRAIEAAKGRDRLLAARQQALALVASTLQKFPVPNIIQDFLEQSWVDVLVFSFLRHGPASQQWQCYAETAQQLAWSATFLALPEEQERLATVNLELFNQLQQGLDLLGSHHPDTIRKLVQELSACQQAVQAQQAIPASKPPSQTRQNPLGTMLSSDKGLSTSSSTGNLSTQASEIAKKLEHINFGTWFEFDSPAATLKLSWFSPTTRNYMFVDSSGQRVAIKPLSTLAMEIEQGQARILTEQRSKPLMDRALHAIQKIFQHFNNHSTA